MQQKEIRYLTIRLLFSGLALPARIWLALIGALKLELNLLPLRDLIDLLEQLASTPHLPLVAVWHQQSSLLQVQVASQEV